MDEASKFRARTLWWMRMSRIGDTGRSAERRIARELGARQKPASGAMQGAKGDLDLPGCLAEVKSTTGKSFLVRYAHLAKISKEARDQGRTPAMVVLFTTGDGRPVHGGRWVMVPLREWQDRA